MKARENVWTTYAMGGAAALLLIGAIAFGADAQKATPEGPTPVGANPEPGAIVPPGPAKKAPLEAFNLECEGAAPTQAVKTKGNPQARAAAQRGLDFLTREAVAWQERNSCYGCHVQAVTVEALTVGHHNQYDVDQEKFATILDGMLTKTGGARTPTGLGHSSPSIAETAKVLGAAAFARYDQWVNPSLQDDLLKVANEIRAYQQQDGSVQTGYQSPPVAIGTTQVTAQAMIVWQQAYERTADDQWLTAVSRAEDYLHGVISGWERQAPQDIQEINYATLGLLAAGVGNTEEIMVKLSTRLLSLQGHDGSWGGGAEARVETNQNLNNLNNFDGHAGRRISAAYATGQTLYTLRLLGMTDSDEAISKGADWLIKHQNQEGGWSHEGFGKAEAMWAVLGLVSTDVLTIAVENLKSGQHADDRHTFTVRARDNEGGGVQKVMISVDDIPVHGACGGEVTWTFDTSKVEQGKHLIVVSATNIRNEVSRRVFEVYTGDIFMTQLGTRYENGGTTISLRNIAPTAMGNEVQVEILPTDDNGVVREGAQPVRVIKSTGSQGAMQVFWDGKDGGGSAQASGRYAARLKLVDGKGDVRQTEQVVFINDTAEAQWENYGQIQGKLNFEDGDIAANAELELVDEEGRVVQKAWTTKSGSYRFRNVDADKKYKMRARKSGFAAESAPMAPAAAAEVNNDMQLIAE